MTEQERKSLTDLIEEKGIPQIMKRADWIQTLGIWDREISKEEALIIAIYLFGDRTVTLK